MKRVHGWLAIAFAWALGSSAPSWAGYPDAVAAAHGGLEDAQDAARAASPDCQKAAMRLDGLLDRVTDLHEHPELPRIRGVLNDLVQVGVGLVDASCPSEVSVPLRRAVDALGDAHAVRSRELAGGHATRVDAERTLRDGEFLALLEAIHQAGDVGAKTEVARAAVSSARLSAEQLGALLDRLPDDAGRLEVVTAAAPKLAPVDGTALSAHFQDGILARRAVAAVRQATP